MQVYTHSDTYGHVLDLLEDLFHTYDPAAPDDLRTRLIMILTDEGGISPMSCFTGQDEEAVVVAE